MDLKKHSMSFFCIAPMERKNIPLLLIECILFFVYQLVYDGIPMCSRRIPMGAARIPAGIR
ncbi:MAG: hypothetical protein LIP01_06160 [Tannerellaceae bacterium]|nr:hypothetical protein [Tannerellaceae bacterium]